MAQAQPFIDSFSPDPLSEAAIGDCRQTLQPEPRNPRAQGRLARLRPAR